MTTAASQDKNKDSIITRAKIAFLQYQLQSTDEKAKSYVERSPFPDNLITRQYLLQAGMMAKTPAELAAFFGILESEAVHLHDNAKEHILAIEELYMVARKEKIDAIMSIFSKAVKGALGTPTDKNAQSDQPEATDKSALQQMVEKLGEEGCEVTSLGAFSIDLRTGKVEKVSEGEASEFAEFLKGAVSTGDTTPGKSTTH
jgi:hypothetical protein